MYLTIYLHPAITILLFILSGIGWTLSFYFFGVYKKFITDMVWWMPSRLQMAKCRCRDIVDTRYGKILGQSNSFWGLWYYFALIIITALEYFTGSPSFSWVFGLAAAAILFSAYLAFGLFRLNVRCRTCIGVHVVNTMIFLTAGMYFLFI